MLQTVLLCEYELNVVVLMFYRKCTEFCSFILFTRTIVRAGGRETLCLHGPRLPLSATALPSSNASPTRPTAYTVFGCNDVVVRRGQPPTPTLAATTPSLSVNLLVSSKISWPVFIWDEHLYIPCFYFTREDWGDECVTVDLHWWKIKRNGIQFRETIITMATSIFSLNTSRG